MTSVDLMKTATSSPASSPSSSTLPRVMTETISCSPTSTTISTITSPRWIEATVPRDVNPGVERTTTDSVVVKDGLPVVAFSLAGPASRVCREEPDECDR